MIQMVIKILLHNSEITRLVPTKNKANEYK